MNCIKIFSFLLLFISISCTKNSDKHLFDTSMDVAFTIPAGLDNITTHYFVIRDIPSFYKERKEISGVSDEQIDKVLANKASIFSKFQEIDYGYIYNISIILFNESQPKTEAFYLENIPFSQNNELKMLSSLSNLKEILSNPTFDLEIRVNFKTFTTTTTENKIKLNFSAFEEL